MGSDPNPRRPSVAPPAAPAGLSEPALGTAGLGAAPDTSSPPASAGGGAPAARERRSGRQTRPAARLLAAEEEEDGAGRGGLAAIVFLRLHLTLHWAAMNGNVPMIAALLDLGADPTIRTKPCTKTPHCKRLTPYELIEHKFPDSAVVTATARLLEAKGYGEVVHGAKINSKRHSLAKNSHASLRDSFKLLSVTPAPAGTGAAEGSDRR